jgi:hypothetical protein
MYLKMMGSEDLPDSDSRKTFRLVQQVVDVTFERREGKAFVEFYLEDGARFSHVEVNGNVYVLNDQGKTVGSYGVSDPDPETSANEVYRRLVAAVQEEALHGDGKSTITLSEHEYRLMQNRNVIDFAGAEGKVVPMFMNHRVLVPGTNYAE